MIGSFLVGALTGAALIWVWGDQIRDRLAAQTRAARDRTADGLQRVEHAADELLGAAVRPLRRAEELVDETKTRLGETLRAGQDALRRAPEERERD